MKSYVWVTFAFMGWGYYEMSGGGDFVPEQRVIADARIVEPEIVTRANTTATLMAISASNIIPETVAPETTDTDVMQAIAQAVELDTVEIVEVTTPVIEGKLDIREVSGSRVNMRLGPGIGFDVIITLDVGEKLEVLDVNIDGWANVSTERGLIGWMAKRLLTEPEI